MKTLKTSEIIKQLQDLLEQHGDMDVILEDADTNWFMGVQIIPPKTKGCAYGHTYNAIVIQGSGYNDLIDEEKYLVV